MSGPISELPPIQRRAAIISLLAITLMLAGAGLLIWGYNFDVTLSDDRTPISTFGSTDYSAGDLVNLSLLQQQAFIVEAGFTALIVSVILFAAAAIIRTIDERAGPTTQDNS